MSSAGGRPARLVDYVQHKPDCGRKRQDVDYAMFLPCTCGLAALVAASGAPPQDIRELVEEWQSEIKEFATKDDPYYNGVRQCVADVRAILEEEK